MCGPHGSIPIYCLTPLLVRGRVYPQTVCWQQKTGRSGWYTRGSCFHPEGLWQDGKWANRISANFKRWSTKFYTWEITNPHGNIHWGVTQLERTKSIMIWKKCAESGPFQWCAVTGPKSVGTNRNMEYLFWTTRNIYNCKHDGTLEQIIQWHCAMLVPGGIQKPSEPCPGQSSPGDPAWPGRIVGPNELQWSIPTSTFPWVHVSKFIFMWPK